MPDPTHPVSPSAGETPQHILRQYLSGAATDVSPLLVGLPGSGKSTIVRDMVDELNRHAGKEKKLALLEMHVVDPEVMAPSTSTLKSLSRLAQNAIDRGRRPVVLLDDVSSLTQSVKLEQALRKKLPSGTLVVATTTNLETLSLGIPPSASAWKPVFWAPTLSGWERHERSLFPHTPHADLIDLATSYLRQYPSDAWTGAMPGPAMFGSVRENLTVWRHPEGFRADLVDHRRPSPRDWSFALHEHGRFLQLTAHRGDEGDWATCLSEIYHRHLSGPVGSRFVEFMGRQSPPLAQEILLDGVPSRLGWRHLSTLPQLADDMGRTLPSLMDASIYVPGVVAMPDVEKLRILSRFANFVDDIARYGQFLTFSGSGGQSFPGADLFRSDRTPSNIAPLEETIAVLRQHLPLIRGNLAPWVASGVSLPPSLSAMMEVDGMASQGTGTDSTTRFNHSPRNAHVRWE